MCLLKSMFAGNVGTKPTSLKPVANPHTKQPTTIPAGDVPPTNTGKTLTTYNSQFIAQNESITEPLKNFSNALGKKIMTKTSRNAQANKKRKKRDQSSGTLFKMIHPAKFLTVQGVLTQPVVLDKAAGTKALNRRQQQAETQTSGKSARLVAGSKAPQTPSLIAQAVKPITTRPDNQIVSATSKPVNRPIVTDKASVSESPKTLETNKTAITSKAINDQKSGKESTPKTLISNNKITADSEQSVVTNKPFVPDSPKTLETNKTAITSKAINDQQSSKESTPKTLISNNKITADREQSVVTNKPFVPDSPKTQLSNATFAAPLDQSSHSQQKVLIGQESPAPAAEETTPNKADTDQKDHRGKTELFELSEKNGVQVGNLSVKSVAQKMNPQRTQLSAPQIENHNNLLVDKASNPDMEQGEQVLVGANAQPVITEPSPASATFAKIAGNADSGANVSSQIQESIHSSFHSGSQQIVIRLNPPELGKVAIKFTEQGDDITGLLQVDKPQTRDQIQQVLPEIIQNLQNSGIAIKKLEVVLTNQQDQYTSKDQSSTAGQDSFSGQQSWTNPESQRNNTTYNEWLRNIDNGTEFAEAQMQLNDTSINMLV